MVAARNIDITVTETPLGWPVACAQSGDTSVFVRQQPHGPIMVAGGGRRG